MSGCFDPSFFMINKKILRDISTALKPWVPDYVMGGRIQGFLAGIVLATSAAYYTSQEFRTSSNFVSKTLRETNSIIENRSQESKPIPRSIEITYRPSLRETIADIWNDQLLSGIKAVYSFNLTKTTSSLIDSLQKGFNNGLNDVKDTK